MRWHRQKHVWGAQIEDNAAHDEVILTRKFGNEKYVFLVHVKDGNEELTCAQHPPYVLYCGYSEQPGARV